MRQALLRSDNSRDETDVPVSTASSCAHEEEERKAKEEKDEFEWPSESRPQQLSANNLSSLERDLRNEAAYLFKFVMVAQVFVYMEAGALPALLHELVHTYFQMDFSMQGLLGGVVYLAISAGAPVASYCFQNFNPKTTMAIALLLNNLATVSFALTPEHWPWTLIAARALIGWVCGDFAWSKRRRSREAVILS